VQVETSSGPAGISRIQDNANLITQDWAKTSRPCPSFCIQPMQAAEGVTTIGELELMDLLKGTDAVVADARTYKWFSAGTIPGYSYALYRGGGPVGRIRLRGGF
jgi:hypothetical protein